MAKYFIRKYERANAFDVDGNYDIANVSSSYTEVTLDDSLHTEDLLKYLGEYGGGLPLETVENKSAQFVGWSTSNTYVVDPASSTTNVFSSTLTSLSFSDLTEDPDPLNPSVYNNFYAILKYFDTFDSYEDPAPDTQAQAEENKIVNKSLTSLPTPHLSGLKLNADIVINGLTLNTIDENNVVWVMEDLEGWWNLPDSELPDLPRGWGDGSYDAVGRYANRILTLRGSFLPQDPEDVPAARNALFQAIDLVKTGGWLIVKGQPDVASYVRLSGAPQITSVNARGRHNFSIGLKAVDPVKYEYIDGNPDGYDYVDVPSGTLIGAAAPILNTGNTPVPLYFEISGGISGASADDPAVIAKYVGGTKIEEINIIGNVTSGDFLEIDTRNREVLYVDSDDEVTNGRSRVEILTDWMYLDPNVSTKILFEAPLSGSAGSLRVFWRSGWIA